MLDVVRYFADAVVEVHLRDARQVAAALLCGERPRYRAFAQFAPAAFHDVPEPRRGRDEEVARIDVAVAFYDDVPVASVCEDALVGAASRRV